MIAITVRELKQEFEFCREANLKDRKDEMELELVENSQELLNKAKSIIFSKMTKRKALAVWDYASSSETIDTIAYARGYSERHIKRFIDEANELISAL